MTDKFQKREWRKRYRAKYGMYPSANLDTWSETPPSHSQLAKKAGMTASQYREKVVYPSQRRKWLLAQVDAGQTYIQAERRLKNQERTKKARKAGMTLAQYQKAKRCCPAT